jgi:ribosomal protein L14E/L6E/L27E
MAVERGRVVRSLAGRDKGYLLVAVASDESSVMVCDGRERPLERAKRKNIKHIALTSTVLTEAQMATNRGLRSAIKAVRERSANR